MRLARRLAPFMLVLALLAAGIALYAFGEARRDPVIRRATIALDHWPSGAPAITVAVLSDIHIGSAAMDGPRLARIVAQVNAARPDLVLIAGDFIAGNDAGSAAKLGQPMIAPLARLRAPLGTVAVLGNHDHWTGTNAVQRMLRRAGVVVLRNQALAVGPLAIGGVDDHSSGHADIVATVAAMRGISGAPLFLAHSPYVPPQVPPDGLILAGHTHCGQVVLPLIGSVGDIGLARHSARNCGLTRQWRRRVLITAGLGTSGGPFRLGAPPDWWLLTLGPTPPK